MEVAILPETTGFPIRFRAREHPVQIFPPESRTKVVGPMEEHPTIHHVNRRNICRH